MRKAWPFAFNFLVFAATAFMWPFLVLRYQELGFTGTQIGLLSGIAPLVTLFAAPLWTGLADATGRHRLVMSVAILLGVAAGMVFPLLDAFLPVLLIVVSFNAFVAPVTPFADSAAMFMLGDEKEMYGRVRVGGTIGYGIAAWIAGDLVQDYGLKVAFWGSAALFLVGLFVSQKLIYGQVKADLPVGRGVRTLLADPGWLLFLIVAFGGGAGLAAFNNYFFSYMRELGANESMMGRALTVGTIAEIPVLFFANRLIRRLESRGLLMVSMVVTGLRLLLFAAAGTPSLVLLIQLLNGLGFPAMWVAGVSYADEKAPSGLRATAQGLFSAAVFGVGMAVGGFAGGPLLESIGGRGLYLVFGVGVLGITAIVALARRWLPQEPTVAR